MNILTTKQPHFQCESLSFYFWGHLGSQNILLLFLITWLSENLYESLWIIIYVFLWCEHCLIVISPPFLSLLPHILILSLPTSILNVYPLHVYLMVIPIAQLIMNIFRYSFYRNFSFSLSLLKRIFMTAGQLFSWPWHNIYVLKYSF